MSPGWSDKTIASAAFAGDRAGAGRQLPARTIGNRPSSRPMRTSPATGAADREARGEYPPLRIADPADVLDQHVVTGAARCLGQAAGNQRSGPGPKPRVIVTAVVRRQNQRDSFIVPCLCRARPAGSPAPRPGRYARNKVRGRRWRLRALRIGHGHAHDVGDRGEAARGDHRDRDRVGEIDRRMAS